LQRVAFRQDSRDQSSTDVMTSLESPDRVRARVTLITTVIIHYYAERQRVLRGAAREPICAYAEDWNKR
jgi:hypothetical protein